MLLHKVMDDTAQCWTTLSSEKEEKNTRLGKDYGKKHFRRHMKLMRTKAKLMDHSRGDSKRKENEDGQPLPQEGSIIDPQQAAEGQYTVKYSTLFMTEDHITKNRNKNSEAVNHIRDVGACSCVQMTKWEMLLYCSEI